jgi:glycerol kinase
VSKVRHINNLLKAFLSPNCFHIKDVYKVVNRPISISNLLAALVDGIAVANKAFPFIVLFRAV